MLKCINADHQRKHGGEITAVGINVNGKWTWKDKKSEVEVGIMENNRKRFLLTYGTPLIDGWHLHKDLGTLEDTTSAKKALSG